MMVSCKPVHYNYLCRLPPMMTLHVYVLQYSVQVFILSMGVRNDYVSRIHILYCGRNFLPGSKLCIWICM